ncbi:MAG TPA: cytochrome c3 family protein [Phycisphaerae bacterium]|mgnify:CR=1 FL=1|jgi:hypothetical protein|nr:cytochrome c3 family protein [Phycisphaerae bacterium]HOB73847.1 cytochrome c3 family protein [Phycisphaerae bacterium]HOJ53938.1 cytochrome c3 family protein [Phycisphaerae bacterium]HOL27557.1 cytochrome c3 family protein [Phycisphaerae bacterium]HPP22560.1 cytochrome c3 family protein [Phycisphaerae bacterium]
MSQIFHPSTNTISKVTLLGAVFFLAALLWVFGVIVRSPYVTEANVVRQQPVPFSHKHHVAGLGIECRYCHTTVETSAFAGMPSTKTCMTCHSQIWVDAPILEPVRASYRTDQSIEWTRVNDLPDFAYFNHSIHVKKGIGCETCHGPVDDMALAWRANSLNMEWCLDCHRDPARYVRPRDKVFEIGYKPAEDQRVLGERLMKEYAIDTQRAVLMNCSTCHR